MKNTFSSIKPEQAWEPLPDSSWNQQTAAHLLRRAGWAATPAMVKEATREGLSKTMEKVLAPPGKLELPESIKDLRENLPPLRKEAREASGEENEEKRREIYSRIRNMENSAFQDFAVRWIRQAYKPEFAFQEKRVIFLENVFVVSWNGFRSPEAVYKHQAIIRDHNLGSYRDLCKAISRSPSMMRYLNLQQSRRNAPNENFARELFELFMLGEGNYTERDVREAARAFTGYRDHNLEFRLDRNQHDQTPKTIFGKTGNWNGDHVIDMALEQPGALTFMPNEMCRFYLSEDPIPKPYLEELGKRWKAREFSLFALHDLFFRSRLFYHESFTGRVIKSPIQFYLGLLQDLSLDPLPFPGTLINALRSMGQDFYNPPNVRGWVGGKMWINSSSLAARRQLIFSLFDPLDRDKVNADDLARLERSEADGETDFHVSADRLTGMGGSSTSEIIDHILSYFLPTPVSDTYRESLLTYLNENPKERFDRLREVLIAVLHSPLYHLS